MFSVCVFCLCFLSVFSCCVFSSLCFFLSSLCFQYVLSVCVFCPCFLSGFAFLSINFDIILLWSGLADQLLFADINSQFIWLQYKYKILTRYFGLSGSPASSLARISSDRDCSWPKEDCGDTADVSNEAQKWWCPTRNRAWMCSNRCQTFFLSAIVFQF